VIIGDKTTVKIVSMKVFNSFGFLALVVFAAVLLTSVSLLAPAERVSGTVTPGTFSAHMTPAAQRFGQIVHPQPHRD